MSPPINSRHRGGGGKIERLPINSNSAHFSTASGPFHGNGNLNVGGLPLATDSGNASSVRFLHPSPFISPDVVAGFVLRPGLTLVTRV